MGKQIIKKQTQTDLLTPIVKESTKIFEQLAVLLSDNLPAPVLSGVYLKLVEMEKVVDDLKSNARGRLLQMLKSSGKKVTDKGSRELMVDGWKLRCRPTRTGIDPKKLEASLRMRGIDPVTCMNAKISYEVNDEKLMGAVANGLLTADELASLKYEESFALESPEKING